jgi:hypothetical protein
MGVVITLPLIGKPGQELGEGSAVTGARLRDWSRDLAARLAGAAEILDKLAGAGWEARAGLHDVLLSNPDVGTGAEARTRLDGLGIDPDRVQIVEVPESPEGPAGG